MKSELRAIRADEVKDWLETSAAEIVHPFARLSDPLFVGLLGGEYVCMLGFIPKTTLSDEAYLWLQDGPLVREHPVRFALVAQRVIKAALTRYPTITGHCAEWSAKWLESLGATVNLPEFVIEAKHVARR